MLVTFNESINQNTLIQRRLSQANQRRMAETIGWVFYVYCRQWQTVRFLTLSVFGPRRVRTTRTSRDAATLAAILTTAPRQSSERPFQTAEEFRVDRHHNRLHWLNAPINHSCNSLWWSVAVFGYQMWRDVALGGRSCSIRG